MQLIYRTIKNYTAGRLAGEQATAASASEVASSGFLRLIKCEISVGFDDEVIAAVVAVEVMDEAASATADFEEPASTSPLLIGLM